MIFFWCLQVFLSLNCSCFFLPFFPQVIIPAMSPLPLRRTVSVLPSPPPQLPKDVSQAASVKATLGSSLSSAPPPPPPPPPLALPASPHVPQLRFVPSAHPIQPPIPWEMLLEEVSLEQTPIPTQPSGEAPSSKTLVSVSCQTEEASFSPPQQARSVFDVLLLHESKVFADRN